MLEHVLEKGLCNSTAFKDTRQSHASNFAEWSWSGGQGPLCTSVKYALQLTLYLNDISQIYIHCS